MSDDFDPYSLVKHFLAIAAGKSPGHAGTPESWIKAAQIAAEKRGLSFPPPGWIVRTTDTGALVEEETEGEP